MAKTPKVKKTSEGMPFQVNYPVAVGSLFWLIFIFAVFYAGHMVLKSNLFMVRNIICNIRIDVDLVRGIKGRPLFAIDTLALRTKILGNDSDYRDVIISKKFPSTLSLYVDVRKPFVQIKNNGFYTIDRDGIVIDSDPQPVANLLSVEVDDTQGTLRKGSDANSQKLDGARRLIKDMQRRKIFRKYVVESINVISSDSAYFTLLNRDPSLGAVQVIIGEGEYSRKLFIFENLMATKVKGDLQSVKYIDLRYKKAYVGYKR